MSEIVLLVGKVILVNFLWCGEVELQIQFYDLDLMEIVWYGCYVEYMEVVCCVLFDGFGYNYLVMKEFGYGWLVIDLYLCYVVLVCFGQCICVSVVIVEWENCLCIDYFISDVVSGVCLICVFIVQVVVQMNNYEMCFVLFLVLWYKFGLMFFFL